MDLRLPGASGWEIAEPSAGGERPLEDLSIGSSRGDPDHEPAPRVVAPDTPGGGDGETGRLEVGQDPTTEAVRDPDGHLLR